MATLAEIRAKLAAEKAKKEGGNNQNFVQDHTVYPFWNIPEGKTAITRFLPDGNPNAEFFWQERMVIRIPFVGIKGQNENKEVFVTVPCMRMYKGADGKPMNDPIITATRDWWNDEELKPLARRYYMKRSYLYQGFVRDNPLTDDVTPENPIRRFTINPSIHTIIKDSLMNPDMEELPTDYSRGRDFKIVKTRRGDYADYTTSTWTFKESSLTAAEAEAIEKFGLFNLSDFLPKMPTEAQQKAIVEMFEASVDGEPWDASKWADAYRPAGYNNGGSSSSADEDDIPQTVVQVAKAQETTVAPAEPVAQVEAPATAASDALARLKARATQTVSAASEAPAEAASKGKADAQAILDLIKNRNS